MHALRGHEQKTQHTRERTARRADDGCEAVEEAAVTGAVLGARGGRFVGGTAQDVTRGFVSKSPGNLARTLTWPRV